MDPGATEWLSLQRTEVGWCLLDARDVTVYEATGQSARRSCLERAVELGAVRLREGEQPRTA
ncbi:MAG: hypothetical protein AVDCRST_MAG38-1687 [uncultured Solirubrobacteraceae bacterium]|uniref:Uncharacterized protein n=1 Tax=uncultured Solirubrobacteraceae bacterium TaxID=1162706 RepID=A0A6J4RKJ4_9ACTN|nr:MAG: hypothetical protein AVDCRST_MAG38-1687 [uncultured Solirubrobacteraceae bacterium]